MATSGEVLYEVSRNTIIKAALRKLGALAKGQTPDTEDYENATLALNSLVAEFQTYDMPMWKRVQLDATLVAGQRQYVFGSLGGVTTFGVSWDGGIEWDGGVTFDANGLTTDFDIVPLKIDGVVLRLSGGSAQEIMPIARKDFNLLNTTTVGRPLQYSYQSFINSGVFSLWPIPDAAYTMEITYQEQQQGFTSADETPDFPQEWQNALVFGLASLLAPEYGLPIPDRTYLDKQAEKHLDIAKDFGGDDTSLFFQIERR
jgi:hypothetical protein